MTTKQRNRYWLPSDSSLAKAKTADVVISVTERPLIPEIENLQITVQKVRPVSRKNVYFVNLALLADGLCTPDPKLRKENGLPPMPEILHDSEIMRAGKLYTMKRKYPLQPRSDKKPTMDQAFNAAGVSVGSILMYVGVTDKRVQSGTEVQGRDDKGNDLVSNWYEWFHMFITPDGEGRGTWESQETLPHGPMSLFFEAARPGT